MDIGVEIMKKRNKKLTELLEKLLEEDKDSRQ